MAGGQVAEEGVRKGGDENNIGVAIVEGTSLQGSEMTSIDLPYEWQNRSFLIDKEYINDENNKNHRKCIPDHFSDNGLFGNNKLQFYISYFTRYCIWRILDMLCHCQNQGAFQEIMHNATSYF